MKDENKLVQNEKGEVEVVGCDSEKKNILNFFEFVLTVFWHILV
jgi:hypothetical protein